MKIFNIKINISSLKFKITSKDLKPLKSRSYNNIYLGDLRDNIPNINSEEEINKLYLDNAYSLECLFLGCSSLKYLPNISSWNIKNTKIYLSCLEDVHH